MVDKLTILRRIPVAHKHLWEASRKIVQVLDGRYYFFSVAVAVAVAEEVDMRAVRIDR